MIAIFGMCYLIAANKSSAKSSKNFDNSWTAVASDRKVGSNLGQMGSPANLLPHYNSQVCHKEGISLRLRREKRYQKRLRDTVIFLHSNTKSGLKNIWQYGE